jgi:hypothetical protein
MTVRSRLTLPWLSALCMLGCGLISWSTSALAAAPSPPTATTGPAQNVTETTATITATVNPQASLTTYWFQYSTVSTSGCPAHLEPLPEPSLPCTSPPASSAGRAEEPVAVSAELSNLTPGTTYHYRIVAENTAGAVYGEDETFTAQPYPPPTITTGEVKEVTQTNVTLTGAIDPHGQQTEYQFEVGGTAAYGATIPSAIPPTEAEPVRLVLANLVPGTTYHYRIVATNQGGTTSGEDHSFTTAPPIFALTIPPAQLTEPVEEKRPPLAEPKHLTNSQKLARALRACAKKPTKQRAACVKRARRTYGAARKRGGRKSTSSRKR